MAYGTRKFIAAVTNVRHWILSWGTSNQFSSWTSTSQRSLLMLPSQRHFGLPNDLLPTGLPSTVEYNLRFSSFELHCLPAHLSLRDFIILTILGESYNVCGVLRFAVSSIFRYTVSFRSFSKPYFQALTIYVHSSARVVLQLSQP